MRPLVIAALVATPAAAQPAPQLPPPVKAWADRMVRECRAEGGRTNGRVDFEQGFFNADALPDYIIHHASFECSAWGASANCGTAGCSSDVLMSLPGGYRPAWQINAWELAVDRTVRPNRILATLHGSFFGRTGADGGKALFAWDPVKQTFQRIASGPLDGPMPKPAAAARPAPAVQATGGSPGFAVAVELTPAAQQWFQRQKDRPVLVAMYQGIPKRGAPADVVQPTEDIVLLGEDRVPLAASGGTVRVTEAGIDRTLLRWVQGEPEVALLVTHARPPRSDMDAERFLNCTPDANPKLSAVRARGTKLRCGPPAF